jgi:ribosome-associated protein
MTERTSKSNARLTTTAAARAKAASRRKARPIAAADIRQVSANTDGLDAALRALTFALDKKALEPILLDVRDLCSFCNYQLVVSGRSDRQVDAISDGITAGLRSEGLRILGSEGARTGQWALLDYGDFVVHVFLHSVRDHYDLEGLWNDAPRIAIDVPADARVSAADAYDSAPG